ncbi:MAG: histidine--tRNA ligase [Ignavibacteriales bacterium]|nr:histidine--tRNA ligase [Ignavibacteriales bacterium]
MKGTRDILPDEAELWRTVEQTIHEVMRNFNYREIRTPVLEQTELFARSIGELTDIVSKEMYTFADRSGESVTMRPEGTASTLRAFIQNNLGEQGSLTKLYYLGPMFRQERPQAGRLRQFHQFGAEAVGSMAPELDVEMMLVPLDICNRLGISKTSLLVNSVGCQRCRPAYKELLKAELIKIRTKLSPESRARVDQNPLRVLDSKDEGDRKLTASMPLMKDHLCDECSPHFSRVQDLLKALRIPFVIDGRLVRGLDYYTKTAFEITSRDLGSQDALAGGGRYDLLVEELGGKPAPGVGFAAGMERLMMVLEKQEIKTALGSALKIFLIGLDSESRSWAFETACALRARGISAETDYLERSLKAQLREANRQKAEYVLVVGGQELQSGAAKLKEMATGKESVVALSTFAHTFI